MPSKFISLPNMIVAIDKIVAVENIEKENVVVIHVTDDGMIKCTGSCEGASTQIFDEIKSHLNYKKEIK